MTTKTRFIELVFAHPNRVLTLCNSFFTPTLGLRIMAVSKYLMASGISPRS